jgi:DNA (cytosine-5)-methyltransferase 1
MFGLRTYRHRLFESNIDLTAPDHGEHASRTTKMGRKLVDGEFMHIVGHFSGVDAGRQAMGMPWASRCGLSEAVPPAYTEHIGKQLLQHIESERAA